MNQEQLFVSVIIPVYNGEQFLKQAIANIQKQNYHPLEIIVVDDGSTDKTAAIAAEYKEYIRYFYQPNQGPAAARNLGIKQAKGNVIAFLDVDDLWPDNKLTLQTNCLLSHPSVDIVKGFTQVRKKVEQEDGSEKYLDNRAPYHLSVVGSALYRKSVFERVGLFNEKLIYGEDMDWFLRAWEQRIEQLLIDEVTLFYHKHDSNMTEGKNLVQLGLVRIYHQHLQRSKQNLPQNKQKTANFPNFPEYIGVDRQYILKNCHFTIICNDRWGEMMYQSLGLICQTPFIGTRIFPPCYIKLLENLRKYLESPLLIVNESRYKQVNQEKEKHDFVIGFLNDVEIHFINSQNALEVVQDWNKRMKRINWDNLFIAFNQHNYNWEERYLSAINQFDTLEFDYKVCFSNRQNSEVQSEFFIPEKIANTPTVLKDYQKYFDVIAWLNQKYGSNSQAYRLTKKSFDN